MENTETYRKQFAEELRRRLVVMSDRLVNAFASVPREHFLGPGPWKIFNVDDLTYRETEDNHPKHIYCNELVAIDEKRYLNNGQPSGLAAWINSLNLRTDESVLHIGSGVGYYSAIMAAVVGPHGQVTALVVDESLAERARKNLKDYDNVDAFSADGATFDGGSFDAIFVNAGATHPLPLWLDSLNMNGRLLVPLTVDLVSLSAPELGRNTGWGFMLRITRKKDGYAADLISRVGIFHCHGARSERNNDLLQAAFGNSGYEDVVALRLDIHSKTEDCWLHGENFCLTTREV